MKPAFFLAAFLCCICNLFAQQQDSPSPIIFIYDASGSMWGQIDGKTKMSIASEVLSESISHMADGQPIGLVAYGHRNEKDCEDVEILAGMSNTDKTLVTNALATIKPLGRTPLAYSATLVIEELRSSKQKATVILVTDGIESCDGNICDVIKSARAEGIDFKLHIVGFGLKEGETDQLKCAAEAGDGQYFDANDATGLSDVLILATSEKVDDPPGNFTVYVTMNGEPIDAIVDAYPAGSSNRTTAVRTYRDTGLLFLPEGIYDIGVQPLENSDLNRRIISSVPSGGDAENHLTVSFDAGTFIINTTNNGAGQDAVVKIKSTLDGKVMATGRTYGSPKEYEVDPGLYNVEVTALVIKGNAIQHTWTDVGIEPGEILTLDHNFETGIIRIGAQKGEELIDCIVKFQDLSTGKFVDSKRTYTGPPNNPRDFIVSPGSYEVTIQALGEHKEYKEVITVELAAGATEERLIRF